MFEYKANKLSPTIYQIVDASYTSMFLIVGQDKAALVDTGIGIRGLEEFIRTITDLPLTVILTHGHLDHAGGCVAFPEVYVHEKDMGFIADAKKEERADYTVNIFNMTYNIEKPEGAPEVRISQEDVMPYLLDTADRDKKYIPLRDGMVFDLGGVSLEIVEVPGHTQGSCCILFREERSILFGDACNTNTLLEFENSTTISEYKKSLLRLKTYSDRYDTVYLSHGDPIIDRSVLDDNIELCDAILTKTDDHEQMMGMSGLVYRAKKCEGWQRDDGKYGNIIYNDRTGC